MNKICKRCKKEYETIRINQRYCEECKRELIKNSAKKTYKKNKIKIIEKNRKWQKENPEKYKLINQRSHKKFIETKPERFRELMMKSYKKNKKKWSVRSFTNNQREDFIFSRRNRCEICKTMENLEIHHKKYTKNTDDWQLLCRKCHDEEHRKALNI